MTVPLPVLLDTPPSPFSLHPLQDWAYCQRYYAFRHIVGIATPARAAQSRGSAIHIALAHLAVRARERRAKRDPEVYYAPAQAVEALLEKRAVELGDTAEHAREAALQTLADVGSALQRRFDTLERVLHVEESFEFRITGPVTGRTWTYRQRPDLVLDDGGGIIIRDLKSTAVSDKKVTFSRYSHTLQFTAYRWWGPRMWPGRFRRVEVGVVDVSRRSRSGEAKPVELRCEPVEPAPKLVQQFEWLMERFELEIEAAKAAWGANPFLYTPALDEKVCITSYGRCPYYEQCSWGEA